MHSRIAIRPPVRSNTILAERLLVWAAGALTALTFLAGLVLWARRLAGALDSPPGVVQLAGAGLVMAVAVAAARLCWSLAPADERPAAAWMPWLPTAALVLLGSGLVLPGASVAGLAAFWAMLAIEEVVAWSLRREVQWRPLSAWSRALKITASTSPSTVAAEPTAAAPATGPFTEPSAENCLPQPAVPTSPAGIADAEAVSESQERVESGAWRVAGEEESGGAGERVKGGRGEGETVGDTQERVTQRVVRVFTGAGDDVLRATLGVDMASGQRGATAHLAFCPPFAVTPQAQVVQTSGPAARIKLAQLLPYGARFEIKLTAPAPRELSIQLEFTATARDKGGAGEEGKGGRGETMNTTSA